MSAAASVARVLRMRDEPPEDAALGQILLARGQVAPDRLAEALALQPVSGGRLGEVLTGNGWVPPAAVAEAVAAQWGLGAVDLDADPPDAALLAGVEDPARLLRLRVLPWQRLAGAIVWATDEPDRGLEAVEALGLAPADALFVVATPDQFDRAFSAAFGAALARAAEATVPEGESVRGLGSLRARIAVAAVAVVAAVAMAGEAMTVALLGVLFVLNALTGAVRLGALVAGRRDRHVRRARSRSLFARSMAADWPVVSILVPLFREAGMVGDILAALRRMDYPRERLDVRIVVEERDAATRRALARAALPGWVHVVVVPDGQPRTKPRALNYALGFCRGSIVGILDAEDRPEPRQFRKVARALADAPPEIACVQCQLSYYNARQNAITRCFQIEYAIWFEVLLRGFQALGLPIPLGGTSVYFRREALEAAGGWDAHNVTEDADLGMRLFRRGMRVAVLASVTEEEANARAIPWIRQRSRWLKGYLLTWLSHARNPVRLWREMGPRGFLGFNVLFLGAAVTYLAMPLFWLSVAGWAMTGESLWGGFLPGWTLWPLTVSLLGGQAVMLGCAALAMVRRRGLDLLLWVPLLPLYWTLGAVAAWKAVAEVFVAPTYWDKTRHGVGVAAPALRAEG